MSSGKEREIEELKTLVRRIILAQGNFFIKELLRKNNLKIGTTKKQFEENLISAIEKEKLTREHFERWMSEIEGWGNQHVYLYHFPDSIGRKKGLTDPQNVQRLAKKAGLEELFGNETSLDFPQELKLTGIYCSNEAFGLVWHKGSQTWIRDSAKDYDKKEGAYLYQYRAYRERGKRSIMRFEWPFNKNFAAVFHQIPADDPDHLNSLLQVWDFLAHFTQSRDPLDPFDLNPVVNKLDRLSPDPAGNSPVVAEETKYTATGGFVIFKSLVPNEDYKKDVVIEQVHRAIQPDSFTGSYGRFHIKSSDDCELSRDLKLTIYSAEQRIRVWVQCRKSDIWNILDYISSIR